MNYVDDKKNAIRSPFGIKIRSIVYLDTNYLFCLVIITSVKEDLNINTDVLT